MYPIHTLEWYMNSRWNEIGWRADSVQSTRDLIAHGRKLATADGGEYRIRILHSADLHVIWRSSDEHVNSVHGPHGFTDTFDDSTVQCLVNMGLIKLEREAFVLQRHTEDGWAPVGPLHKFYKAVSA